MIPTFKSSNAYQQSQISNKKFQTSNSNYTNTQQKQQFNDNKSSFTPSYLSKSGTNNTNTNTSSYNKTSNLNNFLYDNNDKNAEATYQKHSNATKNEIADDDDEIFTIEDTPTSYQSQAPINKGNNATANIDFQDQLYFDNSEDITNMNENRPQTGNRPGTATMDAKKRALLLQKERLLNEQKKRFAQQG